MTWESDAVSELRRLEEPNIPPRPASRVPRRGDESRTAGVSTPAPLKELNPFGKTDPPHLHGFYKSVGGQFTLTAIGTDSTRVTRSSSYQHNLYPAYYWKLWCDYVARRGHIHVLNVLRQDAERGVRLAVRMR